MPRGDGTGPRGTGRGMGRGGGRGQKGGTRPGSGPGGNCVCPACGTTIAHQVGIPCYDVGCPKCGTNMMKE